MNRIEKTLRAALDAYSPNDPSTNPLETLLSRTPNTRNPVGETPMKVTHKEAQRAIRIAVTDNILFGRPVAHAARYVQWSVQPSPGTRKWIAHDLRAVRAMGTRNPILHPNQMP